MAYKTKTLHSSQVAHQVGAYEVTRSISTPPGWDASPLHTQFAGTQLYTWVERGTMSVAQGHNPVTRAGLEPGPRFIKILKITGDFLQLLCAFR